MMKYRGYVARTEIDPESGLIFGEVVGLRDMITFQGRSVAEAVRAFQDSMDLYLKTCAEQGLEPERPYSGSIAVRTKPRVHRALVALARARGQSLNELVDRVLTRAVRRAGLATSAAASPGGAARTATAREVTSGRRAPAGSPARPPAPTASTEAPPTKPDTKARVAGAKDVAGDRPIRAKKTTGTSTERPAKG